MPIYKLIMETQNPSANRYGYFETEEDAKITQTKWEKIISEDEPSEDGIRYYGETTFTIERIPTGDAYFN